MSIIFVFGTHQCANKEVEEKENATPNSKFLELHKECSRFSSYSLFKFQLILCWFSFLSTTLWGGGASALLAYFCYLPISHRLATVVAF